VNFACLPAGRNIEDRRWKMEEFLIKKYAQYYNFDKTLACGRWSGTVHKKTQRLLFIN
jgi:hypothetical protein